MGKKRVDVSPEMMCFVGHGDVAAEWPGDWLLIGFDGLDGDRPATITIGADPNATELVFALDPSACDRLFALRPEPNTAWHLPCDLRAVALAIRDCPLPEPARATLRLAKSIELLCGVMPRLAANALVPADGGGALSEGDAVRILAARRLIDERWGEKLTLDAIARACGLNRAKLCHGFRLLFACSIANALSENRLSGARRMLRETDLPVSSIGWACGYRNNASFTRAFSRRFGMPPTRLRLNMVAA